jgi:DNA mismatch endonuclease (patch repair protein)
MVDVVDPKTRSRMMAGIGRQNTKPELIVRKNLHARGLRYVLGGANLPGRPDIVLPKWKAAIFVHGCFWHRHGCSLSKIPSTNVEFWTNKLATNKERDLLTQLTLLSAGWRTAVIWECATRNKDALANLASEMDRLAEWLKTSPNSMTFESTHPPISSAVAVKESNHK